MLDQRPFMLERITLTEMVQLVVEVLVNLATGSVFDKETTEDTKTTHPQNMTIEQYAST